MFANILVIELERLLRYEVAITILLCIFTSMSRLTWTEMYNYLIQQPNCIIKDQELTIPNMHYTLNKLQKSIELHEPDTRNKSHNCKVLKRILERIYKLHMDNKYTNINE